MSIVNLTTAMLLLASGDLPENPWKDKAPAIVRRAEQAGTPAALREGLDAAWRADDWRGGLRLAELAQRTHPGQPELGGPVVRALWRAGHVRRAEQQAGPIPATTTDPVAIGMQIELHLARGDLAGAREWAERLEARGPRSAEDWSRLFMVRFLSGRGGGGELLRAAEKAVDPANGYPDIFIAESLAGVAEFIEAVGPEPLNRLSRHGSAAIRPLVLLGLPSCQAYLNGRGPYTMIIDTGGSFGLSLDDSVADELGLKSVAPANVRGVSGRQETGQVLVDELRVGSAVCHRVLTRTFPLSGSILNAADGIIGTGIFAAGRMTLDFATGQLVLSASSAEAGPGRPLDFRLVADSKLIALVEVETQPAVAVLDSGANLTGFSVSRLRELFPDERIQVLHVPVGAGVGEGKSPSLALGPGVDLRIGGRTYRDYPGPGLEVLDDLLGPFMGIQIDVIVGMPTFGDMKSCTVDFPRALMWVEWLETRPEDGQAASESRPATTH